MSTQPSRDLERFDNPKPERDFEVEFECPEFTCVCPKTANQISPRFEFGTRLTNTGRTQVIALPVVLSRCGPLP